MNDAAKMKQNIERGIELRREIKKVVQATAQNVENLRQTKRESSNPPTS